MSYINLPSDIVMDLVRQLPVELKLQLIEEWTKEIDETAPQQQVTSAKDIPDIEIPDLDIEGWNEPIDLDKHALDLTKLGELQKLWEDELPAEELCAMLTK